MAKILIAGGSGFIGSHLCKKFITEGHHVTCIDSLITGDKKNIQPLLETPQFAFIESDISAVSGEELSNRFPDLDAIFHLASPASPNQQAAKSYINYPIETMLANSQGTYHLLELARRTNAHFLFASTSEVYGNPNISPQPESYFGNVNPNGIRSVYDESKRFGEALTFGFRRKLGVNARIIRIFNTYGPFMQKDDGRVVTNFISQALSNTSMTIYGDGKQTRSFCYIDDMVEGITKAMFTQGTDGEVINLGNPDERTVGEIATLVKEIVGSSSSTVYEPLPSDDPLQRKPDITKAKQLLQWEPKINVREGLIKTVNYFRAN
jgi:nucleoside-diphosphate-sugar epimerase